MAKAEDGTIDADGEPMAVVDDWADSSVAVPAITAPSTLACFRSLGGRDGTDVRTIALAERDGIPATRSKYCDETIPVPSPHENLIAYKDALLSVAMRPDVRTIIPVRDVDVYVLAKYKDEFDGYVSTPWPGLETLAAVQDRVQLFDAAEAAGVPVPDTALLDSTDDDWDWDREWIVKARYSILADEYVDRCTPAEYFDPPKTEYLPPGEQPDVDRLRREMNHVPLLQEYVPTTEEYGFFALYDHGEPVATFQHRQLRGYSYAGGASSFRESVRIPALEEAGRDLLDHLEWHGLAMVEFLRDDETGEFKLMEINPRFWSSLPFSVQAGADFPYYYWQLANGNRDEIDHEYEAGLAGHLLRGEFLYLRSILVDDVDLAEKPSFWSAVGDVARSMVEHPRFDCASVTDVRPFVRDMIDAYDAYK